MSIIFIHKDQIVGGKLPIGSFIKATKVFSSDLYVNEVSFEACDSEGSNAVILTTPNKEGIIEIGIKSPILIDKNGVFKVLEKEDYADYLKWWDWAVEDEER